MKHQTLSLSSALLMASIIFCHAGDVKITLDQAPKAVQKTIKAQTGSNKIVRVEKADEDGQIQYEVLTEKADGKRIEFIIKADGSLDSTEEPLTKGELPTPVANTVKTAVGDGTIHAVERVTKAETVTYEVGYKSIKGQSQEAVISSEGKLLKNGPDTD